jgi:diguanylate cyclase (GGDEF)-like protein/PAS domain S-box-containing protein
MKLIHLSSLRTSLLLLVFLALLPAFGLLLYTGYQQRQHAIGDVESDALRLAHNAASEQELLIQGAHQFLLTLASLPQVQSLDPEACSSLFAELLKQYPHYANLDAITPDGNVFCSAFPVKGPMNMSDRDYFQRAMKERRFIVGSYLVDRITGKPALIFAYPVYNSNGNILAVISAAFDLNWLHQFSIESQLPPGGTITIVDNTDRTILANYPASQGLVGEKVPDGPVWQMILDNRRDTTTIAPGLDGEKRLFAFTRLVSAPEIYIVVGIPEALAIAPVNQSLLLNLAGLGVVALLTFWLAWVGGDLILLRRLKVLIQAAKKLASGDLGARTGLKYGQSELSQLALTFDQMSASLEERDTQLRVLMDNYRSLYDSVPVGLFRSTAGGKILDANPALISMLGYPNRESLMASNAPELFENLEDWQAHLDRNGNAHDFECQIHLQGGGIIWVRENVRAVLGPDGKVERYDGSVENISQRKYAELALQQANQKLKEWVGRLEGRNREITLLNQMGELLQTCHNISEAYDVVLRFVQQLFPNGSGALYIMSPSQNIIEAVGIWGKSSAGLEEPVFSPDDCWALRRGQTHSVGDTHIGLLCHHVGEPLPTSYICVPLVAQGDTMGVLHLRTNSLIQTIGEEPSPQNIAEREGFTEAEERLAVTVSEHIALALSNLKLRETLHNLSIRDPLTGLFNRRYLEETLEREIRRAVRKDHPLGLIMLDIDHFKPYNDTFGHQAGDFVLREVGEFLRDRTRGEDIACRLGGEEFLLVLPEASLESTLQRAEEIRSGIKHLDVQFAGKVLGEITISLGVSAYPQHGATVEMLMAAVDKALYQAKSLGRDSVYIYANME